MQTIRGADVGAHAFSLGATFVLNLLRFGVFLHVFIDHE